MTQINITLKNETETKAIGEKLGPRLKAGDVICLSGPLGAGKSTLARSMIQAAINHVSGTIISSNEIPSPTFTLVESYEGGPSPIYHYDLYRLEKTEDIRELGLEDTIETAITIIEWAERIADMLPPSSLIISLRQQAEAEKSADTSNRHLSIIGAQAWQERLRDLF